MDYCPAGSRDRIETRRNQPLNVKLARAILDGTQAEAVADVETR
jgi:hypothetical protein